MPVTAQDKINGLRTLANLLVSLGRIRAKVELAIANPAMDPTAATQLTASLTSLTTHDTAVAAAVTAQAASI